MIALACLAIGLAVALLRALPRLLHDDTLRRCDFPLAGDQGDAMSHLVMIDSVRRQNSGIPRATGQFLLGRRLDYPLFFHWLMAFVPRAVLERGDWLVSPLLEGLHAAAMCWFAIWFLAATDAAAPVPWAMAAVLIAASTPILARAWRRTGVIGERSFGFLFADLYLMALVVFLQQPHWLILALAVLSFAVTAASSKFGLQAAVFIAAALAAALVDWRPLAVTAGALAAAIVLSRGYVWFLLQGHIRHSLLYRSQLVRISDSTAGFSWRDLAAAWSAARQGAWRAATARLLRHPLGRLPLQLPWCLPFLLVVLHAAIGGATPAAVAGIIGFAAAALTVGILTSTDRLKFLGEGERYFEYAALPLVLAVLTLPPALGGRWWLLLAAIGLWRLVGEARQKALFRGPSPAAAEFAAQMRLLPAGVIFAIPGRLSLPACYRTEHRAVWNLAHIEPGDATRDWLGLFPPGSHYPFPHPSAVPAMLAKYRPDYLVLWQSGIAATEEYCGFRYDFAAYPRLFGNAEYAVLDARGASLAQLAAAQ